MSNHWTMVAAALAASASCAAAATIVEFDPPGEMIVEASNPLDAKGDVVGTYDVDGDTKGFVRTPSGQMLTVFPDEMPISITGAGGKGLIVGFRGADGFVGSYKHAGNLTFFGVPGALVTSAFAVNAAGTAAGNYLVQGQNVQHAFIRHADGTFDTFDGPNAGVSSGATWIQSINAKGDVAGGTIDDSFASHAYYRLANGKMKTFHLPHQSDVAAGTHVASAINDDRAVAGYYLTTFNRISSYLRDRHGRVTAFDFDLSARDTYARALNDDGAIAGDYQDFDGVHHGFIRAADGTMTSFDTPHAALTSGKGTFPTAINDKGMVSGSYLTADGKSHMFLRIP